MRKKVVSFGGEKVCILVIQGLVIYMLEGESCLRLEIILIYVMVYSFHDYMPVTDLFFNRILTLVVLKYYKIYTINW